MAGSERRKSTRASTSSRCWCDGGDVTLYSVVGNVSEGGLFVRTFAPLAQGVPANVRFELDDAGRPIELAAVVVWRREAPAEDGSPAGMGLSFVRPPAVLVSRLRDYVRRTSSGGGGASS